MVQKIKQILQPVRIQADNGRRYYQPTPPPNFVSRSDPSYYFLNRR